MNNYYKLLKIKEVVLNKKFELFIKKYEKEFGKINLKELYLKEFNIENKYSEEFILFLDYLIKHNYVIKN